LRLRPRLARHIDALFEARSLATQQALYDEHVEPLMWGYWMNWALSRQLTLSLLGVPHPQRREVVAQHAGGVAGFIREAIEYLARNILFGENYFYAVYVRGRYSAQCCPEYLRAAQFAALKAGLVDCIEPRTCTVTAFLRNGATPITRFVLLDHMDWMSSYDHQALLDEWRAILDRASPGARVLFRSAHTRPRYLERIELGGRRLRALLDFKDALATDLARADRVHTYAGLHIADVPT
jgi:S-adenosylmethionine-diacylglycerol 3-amino-3-carboxypropyl transferase